MPKTEAVTGTYGTRDGGRTRIDCENSAEIHTDQAESGTHEIAANGTEKPTRAQSVPKRRGSPQKNPYGLGNSPARLESLKARFWTKVNKNGPTVNAELGPCWDWTGGVSRRGYGHAQLEGVRGAHRIAYYLEHGDLPDGAHVCHRCDRKICCRPSHTYAGDALTNARDAKERGLHPFGERNGSAKLNAGQVMEIREAFAAGVTKSDLAWRYDVTDVLIGYIVTGKIWKHVPMAPLPPSNHPHPRSA